MNQFKRQMIFVDGTNFMVQLSKFLEIDFRAEKPPWAAIAWAGSLLSDIDYYRIRKDIIRRYWFASYKGEEEYLNTYRSELRKYSFEPKLFRKRNGREKGVDIALTKEMLVNAFQQNCEEVILIAGDEDYVELIEEVKRYGQNIRGAFFKIGLSEHLRISLDQFTYIDSIVCNPVFSGKYESLKFAIERELNSKIPKLS